MRDVKIVVLIVIALAIFIVIAGVLVYYRMFVPDESSEQGPRCWGFHDDPEVGLNVMEISEGYAFGVTSTTHTKPHDCYLVNIYKDDVAFFTSDNQSHPEDVVEGAIGMGPVGEYLNFTDSDGNGNLTVGDFFTIERLESDTRYNIVLLRTSGHPVSEASVTTP